MKWMMLYCYAIHNGIITEWNDDWTDLSEWSRSKQTTVYVFPVSLPDKLFNMGGQMLRGGC